MVISHCYYIQGLFLHTNVPEMRLDKSIYNFSVEEKNTFTQSSTPSTN
jgi:hypothetical protein